jgi:putative ABC transport system permease protein
MNLLNDLRYAIRQLRKAPGFALTAILTLAFGIGATTAIFSVVDGVLLRPLPFPHADQLFALGDTLHGVTIAGNGKTVAPPEIPVYERTMKTASSLGGYISRGFELSGNVAPDQINAARMGASVFPTLGVQPLMGRTFTQQEDAQRAPVTVLSYATWKSRFHGDPNILGKTILLDRKPYAVIGVMPRGFEFPLRPGQLNRTELWVPLSLTEDELTKQAGSWNFPMVGRRKPGISLAQVQADANQVASTIERGWPAFMSGLQMTASVRSLQEATTASARPLLRILFLSVFVVLLIACANLAGLLLVRAIRRRRETAVRLALGVSSRALVRQTVLESLVLSVSGGLAGVGLAALLIRVSIHYLPETLPRINDIRMHPAVVGFGLLLAIGTGIICALAPAFAALHTDMNAALKQGGRSGSAGGSHARLRSALVVAEIAIALVLVVLSGLLLRSFEKMRNVSLGFNPRHVVLASYSLPMRQYGTQTSVDAFNRELLRRVQALPGVRSAGLATWVPMSGSSTHTGFVAEGYTQPAGVPTNVEEAIQVEGAYFHAMDIPLLRGRAFTGSDDAQAPLVVIVNRKLAEHYWPHQNPIGKHIHIGSNQYPGLPITIVGEVANIKTDAPDAETSEQFYQPVDQWIPSLGKLAASDDISGNGMSLVVRTAQSPAAVENSLRAVFHSLDPQLAVTQVETMQTAISDTEAPRRFNTAIISAFGIIAALLAMLGIYSVIAFTVAMRTQEIAIRIALGASRTGIRRLVLASGARLAVIGCAIGVAAALLTSRLFDSLLFQVDAFDPLILILGTAAVLLLAIAASAPTAQRAASIEPVRALQDE